MTNKPKLYITLSLAFFFFALLFSMNQTRSQNEQAAASLAPYVLRFHILANSDSKADQNVKLEIRSLVLDYLRGHLDSDADKEETAAWLSEHKTEIEALADTHLAARGFDYTAQLELTNCYFPTRYYNGITFPCGNYDAARITLGKGNGHNWWCVLYPRLCLIEESYKISNTTKDNESDVPLPEEHRPNLKISIKFLSLFH